MTKNHREIWKPVVGFEGIYEVSNMGRVKRVAAGRATRPGRMLKPFDNSGYRMVDLHDNGRRRSVLVHHLVLEAFVGPRPDGMEGCHNNGNPTDNHLENLRWDTALNNMKDKDRHGTMLRGSRLPFSKLTEADIPRIFKMRVKGMTLAEIAEKFGVDDSVIRRALRRKTWSHVEIAPDLINAANALRGRPRGSRHHLTALTEADIPCIFEMRARGMTWRQIAVVCGVGSHVVGNILHRKTWSHVEIDPALLAAVNNLRGTPRGEKHGMAQLTEAVVLRIYRMARSGHTRREIASALGVSGGAVKHVLKGSTWAHLYHHYTELAEAGDD